MVTCFDFFFPFFLGRDFLIAFTGGHIANGWELEHCTAGNSLKCRDGSLIHLVYAYFVKPGILYCIVP